MNKTSLEEQAWAVLTLFEVFPSVPLERIKTTLDSCSGDRQLASAALLQQPPSIRKDPEGWFKHFDPVSYTHLRAHETEADL
eukprot:3245438-Amphidinium_carterae.1